MIKIVASMGTLWAMCDLVVKLVVREPMKCGEDLANNGGIVRWLTSEMIHTRIQVMTESAVLSDSSDDSLALDAITHCGLTTWCHVCH